MLLKVVKCLRQKSAKAISYGLNIVVATVQERDCKTFYISPLL